LKVIDPLPIKEWFANLENEGSMTANELVGKLLRFKGFIVGNFLFRERDKEFHIAVKPYKTGPLCQYK